MKRAKRKQKDCKRHNITLSLDEHNKLEQIRKVDQQFNLSEKVGELVCEIHKNKVSPN